MTNAKPAILLMNASCRRGRLFRRSTAIPQTAGTRQRSSPPLSIYKSPVIVPRRRFARRCECRRDAGYPVALVIPVVFLFLRSGRATPSPPSPFPFRSSAPSPCICAVSPSHRR
ncbi:hypothetical protein KCP78_09875 [Salmonella enterica subsp. enterica]|nr:hypothetical protein KCP78_09875 [Salmonella enterica subsp. enterica]